MSYSRQFNKRIAVHYSGRVSYPASQSGGSVSYSGTAYENVTVNIKVDTNPFDRSVGQCNGSVNQLTGAVVATEAAQIISKEKNSRKVATSIVDGFFNYIRSELSQQVMELSQKIDAHLIHLRELAKTCVSKQKQMETDYNRISGRYLKIFDDLNKELGNRIFELNKPAFVFKNNCDSHAGRAGKTDLVGTATVLGSEGGGLQAKISASVVKKRALDTITQVNIFLWKQKRMQATINQSMLNDNSSGVKYSPMCYIETSGEEGRIERGLFQPCFLPEPDRDEVFETFKRQNWVAPTKVQTENIQRYFNSEVGNMYSSGGQHSERVKNMIVRISGINAIKSI